MRRMRMRIPVLLTGTAIAMMLYSGVALAATCEKWAGKVVSAEGVVEAKRAGQTLWEPAKLNETYCPGDTIRTDRKSRADIALYNHPVLRLDQSSTVTLGGMKDERTSLVDLLSGAALFFSRVTRNLEVRTATVNAGVEGTEFFIRVAEGKTDLSVFEGKVLAVNEAGSLAVTTGQSAVAEKGKAPVPVIVVRPRDAVRWALYYPPIVYARPADLKEDSDDPRFYTHRASQSLAVGRFDEATADIDRAQKLDPKNSDAFTLQSIIAVTQNEKGKALELAREAVAADPKSATARIALSYAQQAEFDLPGALKSVEEAVKLEPGNALAWARLAELQQSFGQLDKSLESAKKAASLSPDLSRTQTVLGFAHLTRVNTRESAKAFGRAIELDQADPLPRLGLGLAMIRDGKLEEGRRELEIAITLDPDNGLIRSYLGKAYFEEKRDDLAKGQYDMAKNLDPLDPTPYFYDAIRKQTVNRPVEALHDLQKAIELNDNRAVYRSRLLLDQDLAARSASLARIYSDLGFQQRALVEGWTSVNTDPSNYSAHRFLADSYSVLPRHEIARVSELLQSQLLQPTNITPIQPSLAESNLFLISSGGAAALSFNEFNPLFNRDRVALQASGLVGNDETWAGEGIVSGIYKKISYSAGYSHFETEGFRINDYQEDDIANLFAQWEVTPKTSIQAEYRHRENDRGDLEQIFWRDNIAARDFYGNKRDNFRVGFRHSFSPGSTLIGNLMYNENKEKFLNVFLFDPGIIGGPPPPPFLELFLTGPDLKEKSRSVELQHLLQTKYVNTVIGAGYFDIDQDATSLRQDIYYPPGELLDSFPDPIDLNVGHFNAYLYSYLKPFKKLTLTVGASGDFFDADDQEVNQRDLEKDQLNPKFGITWTPLSGTTVRGAVFRTFRRTMITDQTLEPTQVAGFNQFFDDVNATQAWIYGAAVDQKFASDVYGGAVFYYRDMELPYLGFTATEPYVWFKTDWAEYEGRAYVFWTPMTFLALGAEYQYEKFDRTEEFNEGVEYVKTHSVPLWIKFYHPSGIGAGLKATYYDQEGKFIKKEILTYETGQDTFWVIDATLSYRLPKRFGLVAGGVSNLFDQEFNYADTDPRNPRIQPSRNVFVKITLALP